MNACNPAARAATTALRRGAWPSLALALTLTSGIADAGVGGSNGPPVDPDQSRLLLSEQPVALRTTCFWGEAGGPIDGYNKLAIETNVAYWYSRFELPAGARIVLRGQFPHARFMSLTTYGISPVNGLPGVYRDGYSDYQIDPDPGSTNPFLPGARRTAADRSYTLTLNGQARSEVPSPAPNTFYVGLPGQSTATQTIEMILRIYRPDRNRNISGDVGLPEATVVLADGQSFAGDAACAQANVKTGAVALDQYTSRLGIPARQYIGLLNLPRPGNLPALPTSPATNPVVWERSFNAQWELAPFYRGTVWDCAIKGSDPLPSGAGNPGGCTTTPTPVPPAPYPNGLSRVLAPPLYPTPANAYVVGMVDRSFGPDRDGHNILVLHGKAPTHPHTFDRDPATDSAGKQVRYWSLCSYGSSQVAGLLAPVNTDCLFDEQVPVDSDGYYTIVLSLPQDRPTNAIARCGAAWMDWGTRGDNVPGGHDRLLRLLIRQQLAAPAFAQGFDKITVPGTASQVSGEYLPTGTYMSRWQFEARGCSPGGTN